MDGGKQKQQKHTNKIFSFQQLPKLTHLNEKTHFETGLKSPLFIKFLDSNPNKMQGFLCKYKDMVEKYAYPNEINDLFLKFTK